MDLRGSVKLPTIFPFKTNSPMKHILLVIILAFTLSVAHTQTTPPPGPTDAERVQVAQLTAQYYRLQAQLNVVATQTNALKSTLEQKYHCLYNLDTNTCAPTAAEQQ